MDSARDIISAIRNSKAQWLACYATGLIVTMVVYGLFQERIMTVKYGDDLFGFSVFLVFLNRVAAVIFCVVMAVVHGESFRTEAPIWKYMIVSLSNVYASTCQYEALKYVSFPVQQLGKSFKMMPVMVWGIVISRKQYSWRDWFVAAAVTGGVTFFLLTGPLSAPTDTSNSLKGLLLLLCFLALDGLTSPMQEKLFKEHSLTRSNQMLYVNLCSAIVSLITLLSSTTFVPACAFFRHELFIVDALLLAVSAVSSQWFIYSLVKEFGALVFAATMNVRQVTSILISYVQFSHPITGLQVIGLLVVFGALFYKSYMGLMDSADQKEKQPLLADDLNSNNEPIYAADTENPAAAQAFSPQTAR